MKAFFTKIRRKVFGPTMEEQVVDLQADYERLEKVLQTIDEGLKKAYAQHRELPEGNECKEKLMKVITSREAHYVNMSARLAEIAIHLSIIRATIYSETGGFHEQQ